MIVLTWIALLVGGLSQPVPEGVPAAPIHLEWIRWTREASGGERLAFLVRVRETGWRVQVGERGEDVPARDKLLVSRGLPADPGRREIELRVLAPDGGVSSLRVPRPGSFADPGDQLVVPAWMPGTSLGAVARYRHPGGEFRIRTEDSVTTRATWIPRGSTLVLLPEGTTGRLACYSGPGESDPSEVPIRERR